MIPVTVVVSTCRREETLLRALLSVRAQTEAPLEILVADDNADGEWNRKVEAVCEKTGAVHIVNPVNLGSAENRNRAAKMAKGEYLAFLDDDDAYAPDKLKNQYAAIVSAGADLCFDDLKLVDENGKTVETRVRDFLIGAEKKDYMRLHLLNHLCGFDTMMLRRSFFEEIGGIPPIDQGDDLFLTGVAIERGGLICYCPGFGTTATVHASGGLSSGENKLICARKTLEFKKKHRDQVSGREWRYIRVRHFAVVAFAYLRMRKWIPFAANAAMSFLCSPTMCMRLFFQKMRERGK